MVPFMVYLWSGTIGTIGRLRTTAFAGKFSSVRMSSTAPRRTGLSVQMSSTEFRKFYFMRMPIDAANSTGSGTNRDHRGTIGRGPDGS